VITIEITVITMMVWTGAALGLRLSLRGPGQAAQVAFTRPIL
jgi:hypothetical protein